MDRRVLAMLKDAEKKGVVEVKKGMGAEAELARNFALSTRMMVSHFFLSFSSCWVVQLALVRASVTDRTTRLPFLFDSSPSSRSFFIELLPSPRLPFSRRGCVECLLSGNRLLLRLRSDERPDMRIRKCEFEFFLSGSNVSSVC